MSSERESTVILISQEGERITVPTKAATLAYMVKSIVDEDDDDDEDGQEIPITNVKAAVLHKVLEFCTHYQEEKMTEIETPLKSSNIEDLVQQWYAEYVDVEQTMLFDLVTAANYMDIKPLLDLTCLAVSIYIKGRSADELRRMFNISEEFSPEEEAQVREENNWAQQPEDS